MTEAQINILKEVHEKLGEHFDAFVLVALIDKPVPTGGTHADVNVSHAGGYYNAIGLLEAAKKHYLDGHETGGLEP